jgi:hypothetical protein
LDQKRGTTFFWDLIFFKKGEKWHLFHVGITAIFARGKSKKKKRRKEGKEERKGGNISEHVMLILSP